MKLNTNLLYQHQTTCRCRKQNLDFRTLDIKLQQINRINAIKKMVKRNTLNLYRMITASGYKS